METLSIRPIRDDDVEAVGTLWRACGLTRPHNDPIADIALARGRVNSEVLVGIWNGTPVASVMVGHDGHRGWVYYLASDPARRGQGIGRVMMGAAEDWLREKGIRKLELMVRATNGPVLGFYNAIGYSQEPVTVMSRWLDGTVIATADTVRD